MGGRHIAMVVAAASAWTVTVVDPVTEALPEVEAQSVDGSVRFRV